MTLKKFSMAKMGHEKFIYQGKKNRLLNFLCLRSFMFRRKKIITFQKLFFHFWSLYRCMYIYKDKKIYIYIYIYTINFAQQPEECVLKIRSRWHECIDKVKQYTLSTWTLRNQPWVWDTASYVAVIYMHTDCSLPNRHYWSMVHRLISILCVDLTVDNTLLQHSRKKENLSHGSNAHN